MRISRIAIKNFKSFRDLTIFPNDSFNIIIGENNSGKSTLFEAIHLWEKCYKTLIQNSGKKFYQVEGNHRYLAYNELDFLRITTDKDIFHNRRGSKCSITMTLKVDEEEFELGIHISTPTSISNSFFRIQPARLVNFNRFADKLAANGFRLDEAIFIYQTRPVAGIHQFEPYLNEGQVNKRIQRGLSHEVLRNKITLKHDLQAQLEDSISRVLGTLVKFELPPRSKRLKDEFIDLKVKSNGSNLDIHLQGSGFLQVAEIISTIEYIDAPLKLLLVDEPDSHIHSKLQRNLINYLRAIDHNQFFIISHNDQFVTNAKDNEVFFLNDEAKQSRELKPVPTASFDIIKRSLGGVIMSLEKLNQASRVFFVEGSDDADYIRDLVVAFNRVNNVNHSVDTCSFFPLRGKDNIARKIEYNKRTLSSLFTGKKYGIIFDRDFSTNAIDQTLKDNLLRKLGAGSVAFSHKGYCIESGLFSDKYILINFLSRTQPALDLQNLGAEVDRLLNDIQTNIRDVTSGFYSDMENRFRGQRNNRPEYDQLEINEFVRDLDDNGTFQVYRVMSKTVIAKFVLDLEVALGCKFVHRNDDECETISCGLLNQYINILIAPDQLFPAYLDLIQSVLGINGHP